MNTGRTVFSQLVEFHPHQQFQKCVDRYGGGRYLKNLSCLDQYLAMAFAQLTYRENLRDIEARLASIGSKLYHMGFRGKVARSTLADANENWAASRPRGKILGIHGATIPKPVGRASVTKEIRELIFKMVAENPTWRAPRIHGELVMLGLEISERSVSRWMRRARRTPDSAQRWLTFLRNHREAIAAMDFFSVPTVTFGVLYVFFVIGHDRRRILHFNVTRHPASIWIVQQLREAFPYKPAAKFLILDHDSKYGSEVPAAIRAMDIKAVRTTVGCPWQNGVAERWVGGAAAASCWTM
jgi:hypothetical protein